jgi:hypothetical protein
MRSCLFVSSIPCSMLRNEHDNVHEFTHPLPPDTTPTSSPVDDMELDEEQDTYTFKCRCSGSYIISGYQLSEVLGPHLTPHPFPPTCSPSTLDFNAESRNPIHES